MFFFFVRFRSNLFDLETSTNPRSQLPNHTPPPHTHTPKQQAGCSVSRSFVRVEHCSEAVGGGFRPPDGVVLCHNHLPRASDARAALVHELVHAYDHCRGKNLDWSDCDHHACSEVRAAALSGDCSFGSEAARGNWGLRAQAQACARRRAALSVAMNPACGGGNGGIRNSSSPGLGAAFGGSNSSNNKKAREAVDRVFEACFADTAPFDRMP